VFWAPWLWTKTDNLFSEANMADGEMDIRHVTIVGVGLLGGSAGLALKAFDPRIRVAAFSASRWRTALLKSRREMSERTCANRLATDTMLASPGWGVWAFYQSPSYPIQERL
jgi:hypothetical protein